ncbi:MAG TPA: hypothetical protein VJ826_05945 [Candidatus Polarisedimenticolaceae bacterium]|nr:hypothetical protein [Candidatus Polarisedimenticolaceae bacterium]
MRRRTAALALALLAASTGGATSAQEEERSAWKRSGLSVELALDARYDDNIIQLSGRDIDRLEQGSSTSKFRITTPDDWISVLQVDGRYAHEIFQRRETRVHVGADAYRYATNDIKNWSEYRLDVMQELTGSRRHLLVLRAGVEYVADFYVRELTDDDASFEAQTRIRHSARYDELSYFAALDQEIVPSRFGLALRFEGADRDYVPDFDERDGRRSGGDLIGRIQPVGKSGPLLELGWTKGAYAARGDLASTPIPDDDISYDFDGPTIQVTVPWGAAHRGRVQAGYELTRREYTTTNVFDVSHFARDDRRLDYGVRVVQRLRPGLELDAEWRHLSNDARFPTGFEPQDDVSDFNENRFSVGVRTRFGAGSPRKTASRAPRAPHGDNP